MNLHKKFEDHTEAEYMSLLNRLLNGDYSSEGEHDVIVDHIVAISEHPNGSDILYYPEKGFEDGPEGVVKFVKEWRSANGKSTFKTE